MTAQEIIAAVDSGQIVCCNNSDYQVINGGKAGYLIKCLSNNHCIGLTWADGVTLNDKPEAFFIPDLFEYPNLQPPEVLEILNSSDWDNWDNTYEYCAALVKQLESVGYTCEYYLDAEPFGLRKMTASDKQ